MTNSEQVEFDAAANGDAGIHGDAAIIAAIEAQSAAARARAEELKAELDKITPELRRYDRAITALRGESAQKKKGSTRQTLQGVFNKPKVSEEAVERNWQAILQLTGDGGQDEFTQVQARAISGDSSGVSSLVFEVLRQDGKIRFARKEGNQKVFRLTHAQVAES